MISLQDSDDVMANLFLSPLVVLLFLPPLVTKIDLVLCQIIIIIFFSKTQLVMQLPAVKKRAAAQGLSVSFKGCIHGVANVCTVGRSDGSDVITKPKFLALMGLPKSLSYGAPLARALRRARELR